MIIDRFEGDMAVLELDNGETLDVPAKILPPHAKEGDCIFIGIDSDATTERKKRIKDKLDKLFGE